uniref:CDP-diacylglycerol--glycerol-3-phosphate 3-phosphatidyltransferase n=1 Tax=Moniliophthora roreri TaxID=221103 RepID=A0A0W0FSC7_MONRR
MAKVVPPRFNEGWGTWHAKIYGADDDVMISGANLNKSYFTNRQDRYLRSRTNLSSRNTVSTFSERSPTFHINCFLHCMQNLI